MPPSDLVAGPFWEHFEHQADMGVRGHGRTLAEAFEQTALALTAVVVDPAQVRRLQEVTVSCQAPDRELLLVTWLDAVIYQMATRHMLFGSFAVSIDGTSVQARLGGEPVDVSRHQPAVEVKGATYTALRVEQEADGSYVAQCVVDV